MGSNRIAQPVWRYLVAVGVSAIALAIIAILQPVVGFLELLYLFAVAFIDTYAGEGPAVLTIVLCTLGSLRFLGQPHPVDQRVLCGLLEARIVSEQVVSQAFYPSRVLVARIAAGGSRYASLHEGGSR